MLEHFLDSREETWIISSLGRYSCVKMEFNELILQRLQARNAKEKGGLAKVVTSSKEINEFSVFPL